jgi:hypothetical protein
MNVNFEAIEKTWFKPKKTVLDELEEWLNLYYKSNRKWYNYELSNHDRRYYEREYINTEFMIVKFLEKIQELKKENNNDK